MASANQENRLTYSTVLLQRTGSHLTRRLDYLAAGYLDLQRNITNYQVFIIPAGYEGRPERISRKFYETIGFWWVICQFNGVVNPLEDLYAGREIYIPDLGEVLKFLGAKKPVQTGTGVIRI